MEKIAGVKHTIQLSVVPNGMFVRQITCEAVNACSMKVRCGRFSMSSNGKSIITRELNGFILLVFEEYSGTPVGAQIMCRGQRI